MRIGIVGTGMIAKTAIPIIMRCGWEIAAVCSTPRSWKTAGALCEEYGIPAAFCDYQRMLAETDMDAVYIAVPNSLHASMAQQALASNVSAIVEKPLASNLREASGLAALAREKGLFLFEAISTAYLPNYIKLSSLLPRIGDIKLAVCNFSQYSSRYDAFLAGENPPVFDPARSGGALMDLNVYNIHYLRGLFGPPQNVSYYPNMERGIDTSGILVLDHGSFQAACLAAKNSSSPSYCMIQGTKGYLIQDTPANTCGKIKLHLNTGEEEHYDDAPSDRLAPEFDAFLKMMSEKDLVSCRRILERSLSVMDTLTQARKTASICFPADI